MNEKFKTEQYLTEKSGQNYVIFDTDFPIIERLCKKVDVVKKVYQVYTADLSSKRSDEEINHNSYLDLFQLLLSAAELSEDYKFLNTALKLNDLLGERGVIDEKQAEKNRGRLSVLITVWLQSARGVANERS
jgi:hypothetical protein